MERRGHFDNAAVREELKGLVREILDENENVGAILLECSDMPPYSAAIQAEFNLPVFDFITMINFVHNAVAQKPYYVSGNNRVDCCGLQLRWDSSANKMDDEHRNDLCGGSVLPFPVCVYYYRGMVYHKKTKLPDYLQTAGNTGAADCGGLWRVNLSAGHLL